MNTWIGKVSVIKKMFQSWVLIYFVPFKHNQKEALWMFPSQDKVKGGSLCGVVANVLDNDIVVSSNLSLRSL